MNKEIFIAVCDRLKTEVPGLRWIDAEEGQLNTGERPAVAFPCCLIDISYPSCETHMGGRQKINAQIQLRVAFQADVLILRSKISTCTLNGTPALVCCPAAVYTALPLSSYTV